MIPAAERYEIQRTRVKDLSMAYVEAGEGDPIVFLHGNPTSSYLWRNVIPHLEALGRCIAPDLIGMGASDKLPDSGPSSYSFLQHRDYLNALFEALGVERNVTLIVHDWGSALGFDWARHNENAVKGIAYMEALVKPARWADQDAQVQQMFGALRSSAGEQMILEQNMFIEQVLPGATMRQLSDEEMTIYRRPFQHPGEDRRPMLTWPRQIPFDGEPGDVHEIIDAYSRWLSASSVAKLFIDAEPGLIMAQKGMRDFAASLINQKRTTVQGVHFIQEDCPDQIGEAIAAWLHELD